MTALALHGGAPVRRLPMPPRPPYGLAERNAANEVVASGQLSGFLGEPGDAFLGGPRVRALEEAWCEKFGVKHAIAMNSATSCLFGAVKAVTEPRQNVMVTPWSMSASVACVQEAECSPIFCDVDRDTFAITGVLDERWGSMRTKIDAIVLVHLFGCPARSTVTLRHYARERGIPLIEDAAQAPGATYLGSLAEPQPVGTFGDVGVFSLNRHKTIQCGEGGIAVTNIDGVAEFLRGYRNHGETRGRDFRQGYVGGNYRLGEVEAAIAKVQLERLDELTEPRVTNAAYLTDALAELRGVLPQHVVRGLRHVYYLYVVRVPGPVATRLTPAEAWAEALTAEGIPASTYVEPLYRLPVFRGFALPDDGATLKGCYPETERAWREVVVIPHVHAGMAEEDLSDVVKAFQKVSQHREEL